jgi:hypothetical protein
LLGYKEDYIYRLLTKSSFIVRAFTVTFAAKKRDLKDVRDMLFIKRTYNQPVFDL